MSEIPEVFVSIWADPPILEEKILQIPNLAWTTWHLTRKRFFTRSSISYRLAVFFTRAHSFLKQP